MLTRDGERVLEVLLIAAGLAVAIVFQDDLPGQKSYGFSGLADARSAFTRQVDDNNLYKADRPHTASITPVAIGPFKQAIAEAAARLVGLERSISRC